MTKQDLINAIAAKTGQSKKDAEASVEAMSAAIIDALQNGGEAVLPGLGKLTVKEKAERRGRNPKTGEEITIPAKRVPHFSAAKALKDAVAE